MSGEHRNSLSVAEIAYIAGLIDGEGTIGIYRQTGTKSFHLKVLITNCSPALFDWLRPRFGGGIGHGKKNRPWHRQVYQVVLQQRAAVDMIQLCRPYLVIGRRVSDSELSKRLRYFEEMSRLNSELREEVGRYRMAS